MSGVRPKIETQYAIIEAFDRVACWLSGNPKVAPRTLLDGEAIVSSLGHQAPLRSRGRPSTLVLRMIDASNRDICFSAFVESFVEFLLSFLSVCYLLLRHLTSLWLAVANWSLT
jgi:hypothetical protein